MLQNILKPFRKRGLLFAYLALICIAGMIWWYFTDTTIMFGNYGKLHTYTDISLSIIMILGFPLFIIGIIYKGLVFGYREQLHTKTGIGATGGIIGTIISGSSCCGLTLASYFGLLPLMNLLPYNGLEIKMLGTAGLLWALYDTYKNLEVCRVGKVDKIKKKI